MKLIPLFVSGMTFVLMSLADPATVVATQEVASRPGGCPEGPPCPRDETKHSNQQYEKKGMKSEAKKKAAKKKEGKKQDVAK